MHRKYTCERLAGATPPSPAKGAGQRTGYRCQVRPSAVAQTRLLPVSHAAVAETARPVNGWTVIRPTRSQASRPAGLAYSSDRWPPGGVITA